MRVHELVRVRAVTAGGCLRRLRARLRRPRSRCAAPHAGLPQFLFMQATAARAELQKCRHHGGVAGLAGRFTAEQAALLARCYPSGILHVEEDGEARACASPLRTSCMLHSCTLRSWRILPLGSAVCARLARMASDGFSLLLARDGY